MTFKKMTARIMVLAMAGAMGASALDAGDKHMDRMAKKLNLTAEQQEQVRKFKEELSAANEANRNKYRDQVMSVLNEEQKAKFAEMKDKKKEKREKMRKEKS